MEEKTYKVYDSLYNVIGVATYEEVHTKGLLHQVVHFWFIEKEGDRVWLYVHKRAEDDPVYQGAYDILTSGHIDPEETHEEAMIHQIKKQLGLALKKEQITHIGNVEQEITKGCYIDHAIVQSYLYRTDRPEREFSSVGNVFKVELKEFEKFADDPDALVAVYNISGDVKEEVPHEAWWPRAKEFMQLVVPYLQKTL